MKLLSLNRWIRVRRLLAASGGRAALVDPFLVPVHDPAAAHHHTILED